MAQNNFNIVSYIFPLFLLNPLLLSRANSPQSNAENSSPLSLLNNLVGTLKGHKAKGIYELKMHLSNLGYMKNHNKNSNNKAHPNDDFFDEDLELAIKKYQLYFHLKVNGALDTKTVENLLLPRCGVADIINLNESRINNMPNNIVSHYTFFPGEPKWPPTKRSLTYSFPIDTRKDIMHPISEATKEWANVTDFKFKYIKNYDQADIKISFQYRDHGDGAPFDGPLGILAHAFAPNDGRLHFDGDERWVDGVKAGELDLQTIGLHELGHILGLGHTSDPNAIMYPTTSSGVRRGLGQDDIDGIKELYHS
ncbi:hypothetical protein BUALT_Bualt05G0058300 [Buddleja alternifolia]|uniref:Peptidase metallopeptidase domain-containing protein n=1 Tax=Buddleja alternifolia TaxID=168488 RepID=A0AAV6XTC3_9LAMI|nr:hypothetical protein BUALT_Bualt05G0058300 [Buddleja alternifolia]